MRPPKDLPPANNASSGNRDEACVTAARVAAACGRSSDPPEHFKVRDYVACLAGFIAAVGLEQTHILGLSFGTGLALELYRAHPDLVGGLGLYISRRYRTPYLHIDTRGKRSRWTG